MIDPKAVTNFNRTEAELQEFLLFTIVVAGKNSYQQAKKLSDFLVVPELDAEQNARMTPFQKINFCNHGGYNNEYLIKRLEDVKMGQYYRISKAFAAVAQITNLSTITVEELQAVPGIGPKTARFFLMHSRPNQRIATLDTHILKWLKAQGVEKVPKQTPSGNRYLRLEAKFLEMCDAAGKTPADMDLEIWATSMKSPKTV